MLSSPIGDEPHGSRRKLAGNDGEGLDIDRGFVLGITRVKVGAAEVMDLIVVHPNHDAVEGADSWHLSMMARGSVKPASVLLVDRGESAPNLV